jgi:membrane protease YdiL (CAAX protease family)
MWTRYSSATEQQRTKTKITFYLLLLFAISIPLYWPIVRERSIDAGNDFFVLGLMWSAGIAGLITRLVFEKSVRGMGWKWGRWKYQWASYFIPIAYSSVVYIPLLLAGYGKFARKAANAQPLLHSFGLHTTSTAVLVAVSIAFDATVSVIPNGIVGMGENLGWQGFLVPELAKITSYTRLSLIVGILWFIHHLPVILWADYRGRGPLWLGVLCFGIEIVSSSFIAAWMRLKSGSVWTAVLLHAMHNIFVQGVFDGMIRPTPLTAYLAGEFGIGIAISTTVVAYLLWRRRSELPEVGRKDELKD